VPYVVRSQRIIRYIQPKSNTPILIIVIAQASAIQPIQKTVSRIHSVLLSPRANINTLLPGLCPDVFGEPWPEEGIPENPEHIPV